METSYTELFIGYAGSTSANRFARTRCLSVQYVVLVIRNCNVGGRCGLRLSRCGDNSCRPLSETTGSITCNGCSRGYHPQTALRQRTRIVRKPQFILYPTLSRPRPNCARGAGPE